MSRFHEPVPCYMSAPVATVRVGALLAEAERRLADRNISCLAVTGPDGRLAGVLSRTDLLRVGRLRATMAEGETLLSLPHQVVHQRMVRDVVTVGEKEPLHAAARRLVERQIHRVFVAEGGWPIGVVSTRDLMRAVVDERLASPIAEHMKSPVLTVEVSDSLALATDLLAEAHVSGLVVVDQGWPVGIFTQTEALAARALDRGAPVEEAMGHALLCLPMGMPLFRATSMALAARSRRILAVEHRELRGIVTGLDLARVVAAAG